MFPDSALVNANVPSINLAELRNLLLAAMFNVADQQDIQTLLDDLENSVASIRKQAISALGHRGITSKEAIQGLIKILHEETSAENRKEAALALGVLGKNSEEAKHALSEALNDPDASVREAARPASSAAR